MKNEIELSEIYFNKREIPTRKELWNKIDDLQSQLSEKEIDIRFLEDTINSM